MALCPCSCSMHFSFKLGERRLKFAVVKFQNSAVCFDKYTATLMRYVLVFLNSFWIVGPKW